jgi:hypothetical protein
MLQRFIRIRKIQMIQSKLAALTFFALKHFFSPKLEAGTLDPALK